VSRLASRFSGDLIVALLVFVAGSVLARGRLTFEVRDSLWAEDARTFLTERISLGPWVSIVEVYEGYLHVVPRLVTNIAFAVRPIDDFAYVVSTLSCLVVGATASLVYVLSRDLVPSRGFRVLLASVTFLLPSLPIEVLGNVANLHWLFLFLAPWLFAYRPRTWPGAAGLAIVGLLCSLTEIQMLLFVPLALLNRKHPKSMVVAIVTSAGGLIQLICTVMSPRSPNGAPKSNFFDIVVGFVELPVLGSFEGNISRIGHTLSEGGVVGTILATLVTITLLIVATLPAVRGRGPLRYMSISLVAGAFVLWAAAIWLNPDPRYWFTTYDVGTLGRLAATRYMVVPSMLLTSALVVAASFLYRRGSRSKLAAGVVVGVVVLSMVGSYQLDAVARTGGAQWSTSVGIAREICQGGRSSIDISATPPSWRAVVPCPILLGP